MQDIIRLILLTVPRYIDSLSRQAALAVLEALLARDHAAAPTTTEGEPAQSNGTDAKSISVSSAMIRWLESEVGKLEKGGTVATRYVVLTWACAIFTSAPEDQPFADAQFNSLAASFSTLVYLLGDTTQSIKPSLRKSVLTVARRTVRNVSEAQPMSHYQSPVLTTLIRFEQRHASIPRLVASLTAAKSEPSFRHAPLLGLVLDVALRLKDSKGEKDLGKTYVAEAKVSRAPVDASRELS